MSKLINVPNKIYLQTGLDETEETIDFNDLFKKYITWSSERIYKTDIEYLLNQQDNE